MEGQSVNLLWTGGWDSTFRLLDLVINQGRFVQPYYVAGERPSSAFEAAARRAVLASLAGRGSDKLVGDEIVLPVPSDHSWPGVVSAFGRAKAEFPRLPVQYRFMALALAEAGIEDLEIAIHRDDKASKYLADKLLAHDGDMPKVDPRHADSWQVFRFYAFPLLDLTKVEMRRRAQASDFEDILNLSWFCFHPIKGHPCGMCNPCQDAHGEGMGHRLPWFAPMTRSTYNLCKPAFPLARRIKRAITGSEVLRS